MTPNVQTYMQQARCFLLEGNPVRAIDLLKKAKACCGEESHVKALILKDLVAACRSAGRSEEAGRYYLQLKAMTPSAAGENIAPPPKKDRNLGAWVAVLVSLVVVCAVVGGVYWLTRPITPVRPGKVSIGPSNPAAGVVPVIPETPRTSPLEASRVDQQVCLVALQSKWRIEANDHTKSDYVQPESSGSGFVISRDGYILTNRHVVTFSVQIPGTDTELPINTPLPVPGGSLTLLPPEVWVRFKDDDWIQAKIIFVAVDRDVAVLKVERNFAQPFPFETHFTRGDRVIAFGFPGASMELANQMNKSLREKDYAKIQYDLQTNHRANLDDCFPKDLVVLNQASGEIVAMIPSSTLKSGGDIIQTNAQIHHGNSGGPLVNEQGNVVGIVTLGSDNVESFGTNGAFSLEEMVPMLIRRVPELKGRLVSGDSSRD
jgi:S1-C subfamily serine protease